MESQYRLTKYEPVVEKDESQLMVAEKALIPGGLGMILFLIFMTLKLMDEIDWSWWWVTSPLWIPYALTALAIVAVLVFMFIQFIVRQIRGIFKRT